MIAPLNTLGGSCAMLAERDRIDGRRMGFRGAKLCGGIPPSIASQGLLAPQRSNYPHGVVDAHERSRAVRQWQINDRSPVRQRCNGLGAIA